MAQSSRNGAGDAATTRDATIRISEHDGGGDHGLAIISDDEAAQPLRPISPARARPWRRGLPFEQSSPRDDEPHERHADRVGGVEGVVGEERQAEQDLRQRRGRVARQIARRRPGIDCARPGPTSSRASDGQQLRGS